MKLRKVSLLLSLAAASLGTSCTARYQDMLRDRDEQIQALNGDVSRLRGENEELRNRMSATPVPVEASADSADNSLLDQLQEDLGTDANVRYSRGRLSIGVNNSVTFDSGSIALKSSAHSVLKNVAEALRSKFPGHRFFVEGHTDTDPIRKTKNKYSSNRDLSAKRADAVASYLIKQGVPSDSIVIVGWGPIDPVNRSNKASNRRVEIVVGDAL
ncbi:MAG: OmpA family protein [Planctomycetota bacterium]|nr:OmpA family protein [Planctomycetota bacterium]MEC9047370.1 OmpA family protein [Planctomycetota bacterium]